MKRYRLGIDIGGTFTDFVLFDNQEGTYKTGKILTTPQNLSHGVLEGIGKLVSDFRELEYFVHGTTAGLNAFLERKGAKVALITTEGFRDVYELGRANRADMYNINYRKPQPLVKRRDVYEVPERIMADGTVEKELNPAVLEQIIEQIKNKEYHSVAVNLLHSYRNPEHEIMVKEVFRRKAPSISVSLSHEIAREWREYERSSTTVINAYVAPIVSKYLTSLEKEVAARDFENDLYIMQSNGGVMTSEIAKEIPIQTLLSGPVGGAIGGINIGEQTGYKNLIGIDLGGTSFDVSLIINGEPDVTAETNMEGFPILSPMVNIHTIGAGGGSIAWIESGGLRVGPKSAGSEPGPACYGNGGTEPTLTDANLVLGRIDENGFLGGDMKLSYENAYKAVESIANQLGLDVIETAQGICDIANAKMADAIRTITVRKGIDPRDFVLVSFGGAGPMHAVLIADLLGIKKVIVPKVAGIFSAWGMLQTDIRYDTVRNFVSVIQEVDTEKMENIYREMEKETANILEQQKVQNADMVFNRTADLRYIGQEYTVTVSYSFSEISEQNLQQFVGEFHETYLNLYGHNNANGIVEIVNLRVNGYGKLDKAKNEGSTEINTQSPVKRLVKPVILNGLKTDASLYKTESLKHGHTIYGPAIIEDPSSTTVVPNGYRVEVDKFGNLEITKED